MPELHDEGHVKWQSNVERHRGYLSTHRNDISYSALYAAYEDRFIQIADDKDGNKKETIYRMDKAEKVLLENFLTARNQALMFGKSNVDANGKPTIVNPEDNRPIYMSDGMIPQCEAFCNKYIYNKLSIATLQTVLGMLNEKADNETGNHYLFIVNTKLWQDLYRTLGDYLAQFHTDGNYLWSMKANGYVSVGAEGFDSFNYAGNTISFKVDRAMTLEYGNSKGYGLAIDLTGYSTNAQPPVAMFSLKGGDMISNKYVGVGGLDGLSSGEVASPVAGSKRILWGYSSIAVFNPYKSAILREI